MVTRRESRQGLPVPNLGGSRGSSVTSVTFLLGGPFPGSSRGDSTAVFFWRLRPWEHRWVSAVTL